MARPSELPSIRGKALRSLVRVKDWSEAAHSRGQPGNAGQFGSSGATTATKPHSEAHGEAQGKLASSKAGKGKNVAAKVGGWTWEKCASSFAWVKGKEHEVAGYLKGQAAGGLAKLSPRGQAIALGTLRAATIGLKTTFATYTAGQAFAEQIARAKGLSDEQAAALKGTVTGWDVALYKPVSVALALSGAGSVALPISFIPIGSLAYIAHSTATNPMAVLKAATHTIAATAKRAGIEIADAARHMDALTMIKSGASEAADTEEILSKIADGLVAAGDRHDEYAALIAAGRALTGGDLGKAVELADMAMKEHATDGIRQKLLSMRTKGWITIGGSPGKSGQHEGGTHVFVDGDGNITSGPAALTGRKLSKLRDSAGEASSKLRDAAAKPKPADTQKPEKPVAAKTPVSPKPAVGSEKLAEEPKQNTAADTPKPNDNKDVPASVDKVNARIDKYSSFFRDKNPQLAGWLDKLRDHVNAVGSDAALAALGEDIGEGDQQRTQYEGGWDSMGEFAGAYLNRHGITPIFGGASPESRVVSSMSPSQGAQRTRPGDFTPKDPTIKNKLEEAKSLPGLEASEDINVIAGKPVTHLTPDLLDKMDEKYGKGKWIVKAYGDDAAAGYGIFFPQRAAQIKQDAQNTIWTAGSELAKYEFSLRRDESNKVVGLEHSNGDKYDFGTEKYNDTIRGDAREWGDRAAAASGNERGAELPGAGKDFMVQPAFAAAGVSDADRAAGKTIAPGEGRVHIVTRNGKAEIIPNSTWIKGEHLPVVFEDDDTKAMAKAAQDAINQLPESERDGQIYAPDIIKTADGYRVVEANPANDTGSSGYLGDNPFIIDAYVSHMTGRTPGHVNFIRRILRDKKAA